MSKKASKTTKKTHRKRPKEVKTVVPRMAETRDAVASAIEQRTFPVTDCRVVREDGKPNRLVGYAAVFGAQSVPMTTKSGKKFIERIAPGAFKDSLVPENDIPLLAIHDPNKILARTSAQKLTVNEDEKGLAFDAVLPDTQLARDMMADVDHGNVRGMSFGFSNPTDEWSKAEDGTPLRTLTRIPLGEISVTGYPAYPATSVDVRAIDRAIDAVEAGQPVTRDDMGGDGDSDTRSACRSAMMCCRSAHDSMEHAMHTMGKRQMPMDHHDVRCVRDMMNHVRMAMGKAKQLRDAVKLIKEVDLEADADLDDYDLPTQPGGSEGSPGPDAEEGSPRSVVNDAIFEKALRLGVSADIARSVLPSIAK